MVHLVGTGMCIMGCLGDQWTVRDRPTLWPPSPRLALREQSVTCLITPSHYHPWGLGPGARLRQHPSAPDSYPSWQAALQTGYALLPLYICTLSIPSQSSSHHGPIREKGCVYYGIPLLMVCV